MSASSMQDTFMSLLESTGRSTLNALFPNDIELYVVALDLVNSEGKSENYFIFPVMPFSMGESYKPIQSIKKTAGGVTVLSTQTFSPTEVVLQGNFGRTFKALLGNQFISFSAFSLTDGISTPDVSSFSASVKTGYGCLKVLESIIKKSSQLDKHGKPYALYFYNLALGNNYLVKPTAFDPHMNQERNMIWSYSLGLKSLMKVEDIQGAPSQNALTATLSANNIIQGAMNSVLKFITTTLNNVA